MEEVKQKTSRFGNWLKTSITARMLMMGFLILVLMIPLTLVSSLIQERQSRKQGAINEINNKWGHSVLLYGPILKVPYKTYEETIKYDETTKKSFTERKVITNHAYFFPKKLAIETTVDPNTKNRNNFESVVFSANMNASGSFEIPDFKNKSIPEEDVIWDKATILIKTTNLKGIKSEVTIKLNENNYDFETNFNSNSSYKNSLDELESSFLQLADIPTTANKTFSFNLQYSGSESIKFIPIGKTTEVKMTSTWNDPSHQGNFLPYKKEDLVDSGFKAEWKVLHINRSFSQQFFNDLPNLNKFAFGTDFITPLDEYQKSDRSAKYGFLVIGLTFLIFFLIQTLSKIHIHPFQYLMIGIALIMFYTLLISISEHSSFLKAYLISGTAVVLLISLYSKSILKNIKFPLFIGASLTALYSFIFIIIQLENYALLGGSIGLFIILAIVMYVSRKIDWQND